MSLLFVRKNTQICEAEITAAADYVSQSFNAPINLSRLKDQIETLIEEKIDAYYWNRFKDWTVADLILLAQTIQTKIDQEKETQTPKKQRAAITEKNGAALPKQA